MDLFYMHDEEDVLFSVEDIQNMFVQFQTDSNLSSDDDEFETKHNFLNSNILKQYSYYVQDKLLEIIQNKTLSHKTALKSFLAEHYQFIAGTALDYVAIPDAMVTQVLIRIAEKIAKTEKQSSVMSILMPGVAYESADERYSNIGEIDLENPERTLDNFEKVLKTHHAVGRYLVPVALLKDYVANPSGDFYCPYYYQEEGEEKYLKLSVNDFKNLFNHSPETQELEEILKARGMPSSLYASLNTLGQRLKANDAAFGSGQELSAGGGMYSPAQTFLDYYAKLESCQFLKVDTEPSVDMLPSDSNMAYALYNGGLYFINRLDSENPIKQISSEERLSRFPIYLVSTDSLTPEQFAEKFTERPIIVKNKNQFYFMGESSGPFLLDQQKVLPIYKSFPDRENKVVPQALEGIAPSVYEAIFQTRYQSKTFAELLNEKFLENKLLDIDELSWIELQTDHSHLDGYSTPLDIRKIISDIRKFLIHPYLAYEVKILGGDIQVNSNIKTCIATLGYTLREKVSKFRENLERLYLASGLSEEIVRQAQESLKVFLSNLSLEGRDQNLKLKIIQIEEITGIKPFVIDDVKSLYFLIDTDLSELKEENFASLKHLEGRAEEDLWEFLMAICPVPVLKSLMPFLESKINLEFAKSTFIRSYEIANKPIEIRSDFFDNWLCLAKYYVSEVQDLIIFEYNDEQKLAVFNCFKDDLARLIKTGKDFDEFLNIFNEERKAQIIAKVDISSLVVRDARDLYAILKNIDLPLFQQILEAHSEKFQGDGFSALFELIQTIPQGQADKLTRLQNLARPTSVEDFLVKISKLPKENIQSFIDTCCQGDFYNSEELQKVRDNSLVIENDEQLMAYLQVIKPADRLIFLDKVNLANVKLNPATFTRLI